MSLSGRFIPTGQPPQIAVVGSINMDLVARVHQLPRAGETVQSSELLQIPGGKGANQAVGAAKLNAETRMLGRLGDDSFAGTLKTALQHHRVDTDSLLFSEACSSGVALIGVEETGQNAITIVSGANGQVSAEDIAEWEPVLSQMDAVLLQLEIPSATVESVLELCERCGVLTILDPAPMPVSGLPSALYKADVLTPNQTETESLVGYEITDQETAQQAAEELQRRGATTVIIKMGGQGALWVDEAGQVGHLPAPTVEVVDSTAAGDAFNAAFAVASVEGQSIKQAVQFACATGSLATTRLGAQQGMPSRQELEQFLQQ